MNIRIYFNVEFDDQNLNKHPIDLTKLSRCADSLTGEGAEAAKKKKKDAMLASLKRRLRTKLQDTEDTDSVIEAAKAELETASPEDVLKTTIELLDEVVESLSEQVEDSKKEPVRKKKADAATKAAFRKRLKDTEDTDSVIEAAKAELETTDPVTVVETVIEVLDEVIENLSNE